MIETCAQVPDPVAEEALDIIPPRSACDDTGFTAWLHDDTVPHDGSHLFGA